MRASKRSFWLAISLASVLVLTAAANLALACSEAPPVCEWVGSKPKFNMMTSPNGYYVTNYGTVRCNKKVDVIYIGVILQADGAIQSSSSQFCRNIDRCAASNLLYIPCGSDGICEQHTWSTLVGGSVTFNLCGQKHKIVKGFAKRGGPAKNPVICGI